MDDSIKLPENEPDCMVGIVAGDIAGSAKVAGLDELFPPGAKFSQVTLAAMAMCESLAMAGDASQFLLFLDMYCRTNSDVAEGTDLVPVVEGHKILFPAQTLAPAASLIGLTTHRLDDCLDGVERVIDTAMANIESIDGARLAAEAVFMARHGFSKADIATIADMMDGRNPVSAGIRAACAADTFEQCISESAPGGPITGAIAGAVGSQLFRMPTQWVNRTMSVLPVAMRDCMEKFDRLCLSER